MARVAVLLFEHTPWGGRQRSCAAAAAALAAAGHAVTLWTRRWLGERPPEVELHQLGTHGLTNSGRDRAFARDVRSRLAADPHDLVVGFDLLPGLDVFYAADPCFVLAHAESRLVARLTRRQRTKRRWERTLLGPGSGTLVLVQTEAQRDGFVAVHGTPAERFRLLPPGLEPCPTPSRAAGAAALAPLGVEDGHEVLLFVGSDFHRKGLDRAVEALAGLPRTTLLVAVGDDAPGPLRRLARRRGVDGRLRFAGPRDDVPTLLARADLLVHPARTETTGGVLLEALQHGVPVVASGACGFASHVARSGGGRVLPEPFARADLLAALGSALAPSARSRLAARAREYAARPELRGRPAAVVAACEERLAAAPRRPRAGSTLATPSGT